MLGDILLWFWFTFIWWLVMLRILSMYLLSTCIYSLEKFLFILLSILIDYYYWIVWVLYIFWILILYPVYGLQIFSPIQRLPFHWLVGCVAVQKIYSLMVSHLFIFYFVTVLLASYACQTQVHRDLSCFLTDNLVLPLKFRSMIHLQLSFV